MNILLIGKAASEHNRLLRSSDLNCLVDMERNSALQEKTLIGANFWFRQDLTYRKAAVFCSPYFSASCALNVHALNVDSSLIANNISEEFMSRSMTFTVFGPVNTLVKIEELADGTLRFDIEVLGSGLISDLRGIFFDCQSRSKMGQ